MPQTNSSELLSKINELDTDSKSNLYFFYSEFLLRAARNNSYCEVLGGADLTAIDGKGLEWANWSKSKIKSSPKTKLPKLYIWLRFLFLLIFNFFSGLITIVSKYDFGQRTNNQVILGRGFVFDILQTAKTKNWSVLVIGGSDIVQKKLQSKYPTLRITSWFKPFDSNLMRDVPDPQKFQLPQSIIQKHKFLSSTNLLEAFPALNEVMDLIESKPFDLILVCIGGASGKQEFLIDRLKRNPNCSFTLAVGVGAAFDHLGGGIEQPRTSKLLEKIGLEWVHRLLTQPYRRTRILYSILGLWIQVSWEMASRQR